VARDVFGNPFLLAPALLRAWLRWGHHTAVKLARSIYVNLQCEDQTVLADALEDAGCTSAELLGHLRSAGPHVRGCWALDLVLGKE